MKKRQCDLCEEQIDIQDKNSVSFGPNDLCGLCVSIIRRAICRECRGTGRVSIFDEQATRAQSTCGESRSQYKSIVCVHCQEEKL